MTQPLTVDRASPVSGGASSVRLYLGFVPVEAVVFVVLDCSLVALVLGQLGSVVEDLVGLELIAGHPLDHLAHSVSQHLPDLNTHTHTQKSVT